MSIMSIQKDRRVHNPKQIRSFLYHASLHLLLRQSVAEQVWVSHIADARTMIEDINRNSFAMNSDVFNWHKTRCRECMKILNAHMKEAIGK